MTAPSQLHQPVHAQLRPRVVFGLLLSVLVGLAVSLSAGSAHAASTAVPSLASMGSPTVGICEGQTHEFCVAPEGKGPYTFSWTKDGSPIPGATDACYTATAGPSGTSSEYCVAIIGPCGTSDTHCFTLVCPPRPSCSPLDSATVCEGQTHTFCTTGWPFGYSWTKNGVPIPGATDSCYTATAGAAGTVDTYCATATGKCGSDTCCGTLTAGAGVTATDPQDATACEGQTHSFCTTAGGAGPFSYSWTKNGAAIAGATGSCYTATAGAVGTVDTYCVTVSGACAPSDTQCATLTSSSGTSTSALADATKCEGQTHAFCTTASGSGPFTYAWTKNGSTIAGATDSCYTATAGTGGTVDTYCVAVTGACGTVTKCATLSATGNVTATALDDKTACAKEDVTFCTTAGGAGPFSYSWTKNGVAVSGATESCFTFELAESDTQVCVTVTGACGPPVQRCATLTVEDCHIGHCLLTQGAYGNDGGQFNGESRLSLIDELLDGGMTVGKFGIRSLSFQDGVHDSQCIIDRLPAGGTAAALPNFGDEALESNCQTSPTPIPLLGNGRFQNNLLGQVITLSLNVRLAAGVTSPSGCTTEEHDLLDQVVCATMVTRASLPGPDGCRGTPDDVPDLNGPDGNPMTPDNLTTLTIAPSVLASLASLGLPQTIGGILELGNRGLAGLSTGTASLGDVNAAVGGINNLFDECRELMSCTGL